MASVEVEDDTLSPHEVDLFLQLTAWGATDEEAVECITLSRRIAEIYEDMARRLRGTYEH